MKVEIFVTFLLCRQKTALRKKSTILFDPNNDDFQCASLAPVIFMGTSWHFVILLVSFPFSILFILEESKFFSHFQPHKSQSYAKLHRFVFIKFLSETNLCGCCQSKVGGFRIVCTRDAELRSNENLIWNFFKNLLTWDIFS